jgi:hypothetical protein
MPTRTRRLSVYRTAGVIGIHYYVLEQIAALGSTTSYRGVGRIEMEIEG